MQDSVSSSSSSESKGTTFIRYGIHEREIPAGQTANDVIKQYTKLWKMEDGTAAYCGTEKLDGDTVLKDGQSIEFVKKAGEKG